MEKNKDQAQIDRLRLKALDLLKESSVSMEELANKRAEWLGFYKGEKLGNEIEGRSQVIMTDVFDVIESIMPAMMDIFYGGKDVVNIRPRGAEDEIKAKTLENKINFDFQVRLNGFSILYQFLKDGLIFGLGAAKYYWEKKDQYQYREFEIDGMELLQLQEDQNYIVDKIETIENPEVDPLTGMSMSTGKFRVQTRKKKRISRPVIENLPPEEFIYDIYKKSMDDGRFCCHRKPIKKEEVKKYGLDPEDITTDAVKWTEDVEILKRYDDLGGGTFLSPNSNPDYIYIYECYLDDYDDQGEAIPMKVTLIGTRVVDMEVNKNGRPPFCVWSPIIDCHRMVGTGYAQILKEIQKMRISLARAIMDNIYFQNNAIKVINPHRIDSKSVLHGNKPGGTWWTKGDIDPSSGVFNLPYQPMPQQIFQMFENILPEIRQDRSGVTKYNQGMDSKSLNKTASGISQIMNASQQRLKLIARIAAETGIRDMFKYGLVEQNLMYFDSQENVKVDDEFQLITREMIDGDFDVIVDVGVGIGSKEMSFNQKTQMLSMYGMIAKSAGPLALEIYGPEHIKEILRNMWKDLGEKNVDKYVRKDAVGGGQIAPPGIGIPGQGGGRGEGINEPPVNPGVLPGNGRITPQQVLGNIAG